MSAMRDALESALVDEPDDLAAHMAYADWLSEQPDAASQMRGEFIRVQLAREDETRSATEELHLERREIAILRHHEREWLGGLARFLTQPVPPLAMPNGWSFRRGWLDQICISKLSVDAARVLVRAPQARLLQGLLICECLHHSEDPYLPDSDVLDGEDGSEYPALSVVATALMNHRCTLTNLRNLALGVAGGAWVHLYPDAQYLDEIINRLPHLRELHLFAENVWVSELMSFRFLHQLRGLSLFNVPVCDDDIDRLIRAGGLRNMKTLTIRNARLTNAGARALARCEDIKNVELLNVEGNFLTKRGIAALRKTGVRLSAAYQRSRHEE